MTLLNVLKHLPGKHNQKMHGWRFGSPAKAKASMQGLSKLLREEYKRRARGITSIEMDARTLKAYNNVNAAKDKYGKAIATAKKDIATATAAIDKYNSLNDKIVKLRDDSYAAWGKWYDANDKARAIYTSDEYYAWRTNKGDAIKAKAVSLDSKLEKASSDLGKLQDQWDNDVYYNTEALRSSSIKTIRKAMDSYQEETATDREVLMGHYLREAATKRKALPSEDIKLSKQISKLSNERVKLWKEGDELEVKLTTSLAKAVTKEERDKAVQDSLDATDKLIQKFETNRQQLKELEDKRDYAYQNLVTVDKPSKLSARIVEDRSTPDMVSGYERGKEDFKRLVTTGIYDQANVTIAATSLDNASSGISSGRSYHRQDGLLHSTVYMASGEPSTVVHEMGHSLEAHDSFVHKQAMEFLKRRVGNEPLESLKAITGNPAYADSEVTRKDKFIHPYIGKNYTNASEVVSMGLEYFSKEPKTLANQDPDMFDFIYAVARS